MIVKVLLLSIVIMALVFIGFGVNILFKKNGKFPELHIGRNEGLKKEGIYCATTQDKLEQFKVKKAQQFNQPTLLDKELESL